VVDIMKKTYSTLSVIGIMFIASMMAISTVSADEDGISITDECPEHGASNVSLTLSSLNFTLDESHGYSLDYTVETKPDIGSGSDFGVGNGTYFIPIIVTPLEWNTLYTWYVNVTDGMTWHNETFIFTTIEKPQIVEVDDDADLGWYDCAHVKTIEEALQNVSEGGMVYVHNGTYFETLTIAKPLSLIGENQVNTIINGQLCGDTINVSATVTVGGFTISNGLGGIRVHNATDVIIAENTISQNGIGILIESESNNTVVCYNNFNNTINAQDLSNDSHFDYDGRGNYWNDYNGTDADGDRIGDIPYTISGGESKDRYPLMFPFGELPPVARFTYTIKDNAVSFESSSYDIDGSIASYYWEFGDGTNATEADPEHEYEGEYATFMVNLTVTDNDGHTGTFSHEVKTNDTTAPTIHSMVPEKGIYLRGKKSFMPRPIRMALIIGDITIEVNASDEGSGIKQVNFFIDSIRTRGNPVGNDTEAPYTYNWTKTRFIRFFHMHVLKVEVIDNAGNSATKTMMVRRIL